MGCPLALASCWEGGEKKGWGVDNGWCWLCATKATLNISCGVFFLAVCEMDHSLAVVHFVDDFLAVSEMDH